MMDPLNQRMHDYYNRSGQYIELMRSHGSGFFESYLRLIAGYAKEAGRLLDVGCGSGASTHAIASRFPHLDCIGIDISETAIRFAQKSYSLENLHFETADAASLAYPASTFTVVSSCDCLEHVPDPEAVLHELLRVLKPGGYLIIKSPNHMSPLYTALDIMSFRCRYPFTRSWSGNFHRLFFELKHILSGLAGRVDFIRREPDLSNSVQVGNDADAVTDMCNLDVCNFLKKANLKMLNVSWPRGTGRGGMIISRLFPLLGSMGIVAQK